MTPEQKARQHIDQLLRQSGWEVQDYAEMNITRPAIAVREFPLKTGWADYLLLVEGQAIGAVEAKKAGTTLIGVEPQSKKYGEGLPDLPPAWRPGQPLPFLYESTGYETRFTNTLDPKPASRRVFSFHRPEMLQWWASQPPTLRHRLRSELPPLEPAGLWPPQVEAISNLEQSLAENRPRALVQMATGSGKTFTAVTAIYRLIKFGGARRILFLVDRNNLGRQAHNEFQQYQPPDDGRKFTQIYNTQQLSSNAIDPDQTVYITTIQRLYSILRGEPLEAELEEPSMDELEAVFAGPPKSVVYNPTIPPEFFDIIFIDECHRSIYNLWRQVLEYFDAFLIGLTATPSKQSFGFFNKNLVMEYPREKAVVDGINVDHQVYRIRTRITGAGSTIQAGYTVEKRDRQTRRQRWERLDEDLSYTPSELDNEVVAKDQIRTIVRQFKQDLFQTIFPGRSIVPKTLVFAKDDAHAENIVEIIRQEFGEGNDFCQKITYKVTGVSPETLISQFRNAYNPRIAVTVDMIATGTDIKPVEIVMFMRLVKSPNLFEQMLGRGTRVIHPDDLRKVTGDARSKDHFVIIDGVGVVEHPKIETRPLERQPSVPFKRLIERVAMGATDDDTLSTLASRLTRLHLRHLDPADEAEIQSVAEGLSPSELADRFFTATDPDAHLIRAQAETGQVDPPPVATEQAADSLRREAATLLVGNVPLRKLLLELQARSEVVIDDISLDVVEKAGFSAEATEQTRAMVASFREFIEENKDEIDALQIIYNMPQIEKAPPAPQRGEQTTIPLSPALRAGGSGGQLRESAAAYQTGQLTWQHLRELEAALKRYQPNWTTEALWQAYERLKRGQRPASGPRVLTDLISLVRAVVQLEDELVPYPERVQQRYEAWLAEQQAAGRRFSPQQRQWLDRIAEAVGVNLRLSLADIDEEFYDGGGLFAAQNVFGELWPTLLDELNEALNR